MIMLSIRGSVNGIQRCYRLSSHSGLYNRSSLSHRFAATDEALRNVSAIFAFKADSWNSIFGSKANFMEHLSLLGYLYFKFFFNITTTVTSNLFSYSLSLSLYYIYVYVRIRMITLSILVIKHLVKRAIQQLLVSYLPQITFTAVLKHDTFSSSALMRRGTASAIR